MVIVSNAYGNVWRYADSFTKHQFSIGIVENPPRVHHCPPSNNGGCIPSSNQSSQVLVPINGRISILCGIGMESRSPHRNRTPHWSALTFGPRFPDIGWGWMGFWFHLHRECEVACEFAIHDHPNMYVVAADPPAVYFRSSMMRTFLSCCAK